MNTAGISVPLVISLLLWVGLAGCAPTRTYEWSSDNSGQLESCYDSCTVKKYKCYVDCDFGFRCEVGCDEAFKACLSTCPGLTVRPYKQ